MSVEPRVRGERGAGGAIWPLPKKEPIESVVEEEVMKSSRVRGEERKKKRTLSIGRIIDYWVRLREHSSICVITNPNHLKPAKQVDIQSY